MISDNTHKGPPCWVWVLLAFLAGIAWCEADAAPQRFSNGTPYVLVCEFFNAATTDYVGKIILNPSEVRVWDSEGVSVTVDAYTLQPFHFQSFPSLAFVDPTKTNEAVFYIQGGGLQMERTNNDTLAPSIIGGGGATEETETDIDGVLSISAATMTLGVVCGGLVFASRYLWRLFQRLLGGATWRE